MSDYDFTKDHQSPGPDEPASVFGQTPPSIDPRIQAAKENPIMHTNPKSAIIDHEASDAPINAHTMTNLCDRLNHIDAYVASLGGHLTGLNDRLTGPVPQETGAGGGAKKDPSGCLSYAHVMVDEINRRLQYLEGEIKRLDRNIGE